MRISINTKIVGSFVVGVLLALLFLFWNYMMIQSLLTAFNRMGAVSKKVEITSALQLQLSRLRQASSDYLITGSIEKRDEFDRIVTELSALLAELDSFGGDVEWNRAATRVRQGILSLSDMTLDLMYIDDPVGDRDAARLMEETSRFADKVISDAEVFHMLAENEYIEMSSDTSALESRVRLFLYLVFPVIGLLSIAALYFSLRRMITAPLRTLSRFSEGISKGDYSTTVRVETGDELQDLAEGLNAMAEAIREREARMVSLVTLIDTMNEELLKASRSKKAFLANISHELRTPLTHIMGFSELLEMDIADTLSEKNKKHLAQIRKSASKLLNLINDLLEFTRSTVEVDSHPVAEIDVREVVDEVVAEFSAPAAEKEVTIRKAIAPDVKTIWADRAMFRQMLASLVSNAVKFTPRSGVVSVEVSTAMDEKRLTPLLRVSVKDTGIGIEPEALSHIFDIFEVGEKRYSKMYDGMGIGLALTKRFVEFHGGKIWAESAKGRGSEFTFIIPVSHDRSGRRPPDRPPV